MIAEESFDDPLARSVDHPLVLLGVDEDDPVDAVSHILNAHTVDDQTD